ncbi:hypothetical protein STANM309S_06326 [Streptomyces tanashiensis]
MRPSFSRLYVSPMTYRPKCASRRKTPASFESARRSIPARTSGSRSFAIRSGTGRARISPQPGMRLRAQKVPRDMFMGVRIGIVRATIRPPDLRARSEAVSWRGTRSGTAASMVRTFQLRGRPAAAVISTNSSISSSENWSRHPARMASICVPSCSPTAFDRAISSAGRACREATGAPSPSEWVEDWVVESPQAPASMASFSRATICASCSDVGCPPTASAPITYRRRAQWPTMKPALTAIRPSRASRYSAKEDQLQSTPSSRALRAMPSTFEIIRRV